MGKLYERLDDRLRDFIANQPMFFVATAPLSGGHVNVSPKGYSDTFAVLDDHTVGYLELYGSGAETVAHLRENGRITIMFCSFGRSPKILRLYGTGRAIRPDSGEWEGVARHFGVRHVGVRSIIVVHIHRIADSCGYSVPYMGFAGERPMLDDQHGRRSADQWPERVARNAASIDGLPALEPDHPAPLSQGPAPLSQGPAPLSQGPAPRSPGPTPLFQAPVSDAPKPAPGGPGAAISDQPDPGP
ncbi:pyridoxamine 5'-phosphate oxidase family protein [Actinomadura sp. HBU206391]|uniref:pyridoxamine 5'-phosphate oxidase family protein n=1 Tax=Actinomadura sp. HBU206391 TaxID=2731692 RepID=UPI0016503ABD|nr:pyridoxamine 5'-phosphate oxidase family protein [Actinomadura sp. HBU206391]MBC6461972.1 pyridoxamine 5'-phosphate oxidase family protein [Actinomadura sp. HBU206391]